MNTIAPATTLSCLTGDTILVDTTGRVRYLEDLASDVDSTLLVPTVDEHGRLTSTTVYDFTLDAWVSTVYKITMSNGHKVEATENQQFLTASGEWLPAKQLVFGHLLRTATYDPQYKNPNLSINEVSSITVKELSEPIPVYNFKIKKDHGVFIAQLINNTFSLICIQSAK
jgi:hypothetical protein